MKVVHAGEHGAVNIYGGQMTAARVRSPSMMGDLAEFQRHEMRHREIFGTELARRAIRRCRTYRMCGLGGWTLGFVTGLLGPSAIGATTVAVERVVLKHLEEYCAALAGTDAAAHAALSAIVADERAHHDHFLGQDAQQPWFARIIDRTVAGSTELVIWMGMRL